MIKIVYDPKEGQVVSDANIEDFYNVYLTQVHRNQMKVTVGSETMVMRFRLGVALGELPADQVEFWFEDKQIDMTSFASFKSLPPKGYCDYTNNYIREMTKNRRPNFEVIK